MAQDGIRAQMEAHWRAFDALADSQTRGNETIVRALEVFEGVPNQMIAQFTGPDFFSTLLDLTRTNTKGPAPLLKYKMHHAQRLEQPCVQQQCLILTTIDCCSCV